MPPQFVFQMNDVTKMYGERTVLSDINLSFYYGAKIGIVGENGSGKSTLLRIMAGLDSDIQGEAVIGKRMRARLVAQEPQLAMDKTVRLFEEGIESSRFQKEQVQASAFLKRSYGERFKKINVDYGLQYLEKDYSELGPETTEPPPPDQANVTPSIGISKQNIGWSTRTFVDKMGSKEDFSTGMTYGGKAGLGIPVGDSLKLYKARLFVVSNTEFRNKRLLELTALADSEVVRNTFLSLDAKYYKNFSRHTLALHYLIKWGFELDSSRQFQLGADSGLRGYPARSFTGEKMMLLNIEDRQFWGTYSIVAEFEFGTVVFVDAGNVWKDDQDIDLGDLNWSAGVGMRIGLENMASSPILRLDYGWALSDNSGSEITVGLEQHF